MSEQFPKGLNQALARLVLANQRRRLAISLRRLARIDSADAPPKLSSDIEVARAKIARIKEILRDYGEEVDHHPDDDAPAA
jgi:hypothetical protein